jgi:enoyl-CoA hydratase/carnithine racemase
METFMNEQNILLTKQNETAIVRINRPQLRNSLNRSTVDELDRIVEELAHDKAIRTVIFTGGEDHFAAGADIKEMMDGNPEFARAFSFKDTFNKIEALEKITIAAIAGFTLGGGLELALACDFRIAKTTARFGLPEITLGIFPGAGGTQRLPRLIGMARAKEMIFLGTMIDATAALDYGLVCRVTEGSVLDEAMLLANKLNHLPPIALRMAKQLIQQGMDSDLKTGIDFEAVSWTNLFATEDQKEGMKAFLEKRKAVFTGK